jgi:diguanylate cyclase (GGDEF)-like protein/PAS domain S-box-containing protein
VRQGQRVSYGRTGPPASLGLRVLRITWPFLAIVVVLVLLATESLKIVSASRAYVGGESLWSKAQKEAVYHLFRYAQSRSDADFDAYKAAIAVPMGDRQARLELDKADPDLAVARAGFIAGKNDPDDVDGMIMLFRRFRDVSFMKRAIAIWAEGDERIAELNVAAEDLRAKIVAGEARPDVLGPILARIDDVNRRLTPLEEAFSYTLGDASRQTQGILVIALVVTALILVVAGAAMSRRMLHQSAELEGQLFAERDRAQVTLRSIAEGVITTDEHGHVDTLNPAAQAMTGWTNPEVAGKPVDSVFQVFDEANRSVHLSPVPALLRESKSLHWSGNTILVRRDGNEIGVDLSAAPIRDRDGTIIGAVIVFYDVTDDRRSIAQLSYQARHDALTGIPNRREFEHRLSRALADAAALDRQHAVLYLDLDRFKEVNDLCGHAAGDTLLREISPLLQRKLRQGDTLARLGGDEFGVLLENCPPESAMRIAEALREAVAEFRFAWKERQFALGISVGLVPIAEERYSVADVLNAADACCYKAKRSGRNRVHVNTRREEAARKRHG